MNEEENTDDSIIGNLIKKSFVTVPSEKFTDNIMERIEAEKTPVKPSLLSFRLSWTFLIVAIMLVPITIRIITAFFHQSHLTAYIEKYSAVLLVLFSFIILLQLDNLLKIFFVRKKSGLLFGR
jgi:hypothetical protein